MAASVMPQPSPHFGTNPDVYPPAMFGPYTDQSNIPSGNQSSYLYPSVTEHTHFASPPKWQNQQISNRPSSKSPNFRERTPIRHNRTSMSRPRSTSRPDVLLAYATEQSLQQQQQQQQMLSQQSPQQSLQNEAMPPPYTPQLASFTAHPATSPFLQQNAYFESPNPNQTSFPHLMNQQMSQRAPEYYSMARQEIQLPSVATATLNPSDTIYTQSRSQNLPSMSAIPANFPPIPQPLESTPSDVDVVSSRQKPQCWDHGCNGRQFSTFSNLLRHQREKSGTASKARCPHCGTEFTRTTARNGHLYGGKCKGMPDGMAKDAIEGSNDNISSSD